MAVTTRAITLAMSIYVNFGSCSVEVADFDTASKVFVIAVGVSEKVSKDFLIDKIGKIKGE